MEENKFWALIWKLVFGAFCVLVLTIGGCHAYIAGQNDPIASSCAIGISHSACLIVNGRGK